MGFRSEKRKFASLVRQAEFVVVARVSSWGHKGGLTTFSVTETIKGKKLKKDYGNFVSTRLPEADRRILYEQKTSQRKEYLLFLSDGTVPTTTAPTYKLLHLAPATGALKKRVRR